MGEQPNVQQMYAEYRMLMDRRRRIEERDSIYANLASQYFNISERIEAKLKSKDLSAEERSKLENQLSTAKRYLEHHNKKKLELQEIWDALNIEITDIRNKLDAMGLPTNEAKIQVVEKLISLADRLDEKGLSKEASVIDGIIKNKTLLRK